MLSTMEALGRGRISHALEPVRLARATGRHGIITDRSTLDRVGYGHCLLDRLAGMDFSPDVGLECLL